MSDERADRPTGEDGSGPDETPARDQVAGDDSTDDSTRDPLDGAQDTGTADAGTGDAPAVARPGGRKGLFLGLGGAVAAAVLAVTAFAWPGFLAGPGTPDDTAAAAVAALAAKDPAEVDRLTCRSPDGTPTAQLAPQALELIQAVEPTGPPNLVLDTQAHAPVDLTLTAQGQTQRVPADVLLGVTDDAWCLNGIALRQ